VTNTTRLAILGFLALATVMEVTGDAIVRIGLAQPSPMMKAVYFIGGGLLLFGYGYALNSAPIAFDKVAGIYIAVLFVVWQVVSFALFRTLPSVPLAVGGTLIIAGGLIVAFWHPGGSAG
jgi:small multidrug resistance family-3 protein